MIAKLEFNLPEEREEFNLCVNGVKYRACLDDILNYFRNQIKYNSDAYTEVELNLLETVRSAVSDIIIEREAD